MNKRLIRKERIAVNLLRRKLTETMQEYNSRKKLLVKARLEDKR